MSKSVKGSSPLNQGGRNPFKSAGPYETPGVGEACPPKGPSPKSAPAAEPVAEESEGEEGEG